MDFVIPLTTEGLLSSDSVHRYSVKNEFDISSLREKEVSKKISGIKSHFTQNHKLLLI